MSAHAGTPGICRRFRWPLIVLALAAAGGLASWSPFLSAEITSRNPPRFEICIDYHCDRTTDVTMEPRHWRTISGMFNARSDPQLERALIARAVALFEQYVGEQAGTAGDLPRNTEGVGLPGQLDCVSESLNTTTYLRALKDAGLLRWHAVEDRAKRTSWLVNIHWAAVIRDLTAHRKFAVDSWYLANGQAPYVQDIEEWYARASLPPNPDAGN